MMFEMGVVLILVLRMLILFESVIGVKLEMELGVKLVDLIKLVLDYHQ